MAETGKYGLPLLDGAQAQKHVTVNEALTRIDALAAPRLESRALSTPPPAPSDGALFAVGSGAGGDWSGRDGALALWSNGGWSYARPALGQRAWVADELREAMFDGLSWVVGQGAMVAGAATALEIATLDHAVAAGAVSSTVAFIPDKAVVLGVTARVLAAMDGPGLTGWRLGAVGDAGRYGGGYGLAAGSYAHGVTGAPLAYYGGAGLVLEAEGGSFASGMVRLCAHYLALTPPRWP